MKKLSLLLGILCLCFSSELVAQSPWEINEDALLKKSVIEQFNAGKEALYAEVKETHKRKIYKQVIEELDELFEQFDADIKDNNFIFDPEIYAFVDEQFQHLKKANPELQDMKGFLISKETTLNAYSIPNHFIVIHLGLFYWLNNQDQMASILAHEMGHGFFQHGLNHRVESLIFKNSKANKKTLKKLKRKKRGKSIQARAAFQSKLYANSKHRRENEFQADSIGYHFIANTNFDADQIISSMELSSMYDSLQPVGLGEKIYRELFDIEEQAFKEEWLQIEDLSNYNYDIDTSRFIKDSIASHPEMEIRIERLTTLFPHLKKGTQAQASDDFLTISEIAKRNRVVSFYEDELYANSLYECLLRIQRDDEVDYYRYWLGKNLEALSSSRKNYTFNKHVSRVNPKKQSESYMQYLSFLWNLSASELFTIADYYLK